MKYVEFLWDGKPKGRVVLRGGKITYEDLPKLLVDELRYGGVRTMKKGSPDPVIVKPTKQPELFLKLLPQNYAGSRCRATEVQSG